MAPASVVLPVIYVSALAVIFTLFVRYSRARQLIADKKASYFPVHVGKYEYEELAEQFSPNDDFGRQLLMSALMKRAMEDVRRALKLREEKPSLQQVVRDGIVGEDLWDKLLKAEQELEAELQEVMEEAEIYKEGWGKGILQEASQLTQMHIQQIHQMEAQARAQSEAVEKQRFEQLEKSESPAKRTSVGSENSGNDKENTSPISNLDREAIERELLEEEAREARLSASAESEGKPKSAKSGSNRRKKK